MYFSLLENVSLQPGTACAIPVLIYLINAFTRCLFFLLKKNTQWKTPGPDSHSFLSLNTNLTLRQIFFFFFFAICKNQTQFHKWYQLSPKCLDSRLSAFSLCSVDDFPGRRRQRINIKKLYKTQNNTQKAPARLNFHLGLSQK